MTDLSNWPDSNGHYHLIFTIPLTRDTVERIRDRDYDDQAGMPIIESLGEMTAEAIVGSFDRFDEQDAEALIKEAFDD